MRARRLLRLILPAVFALALGTAGPATAAPAWQPAQSISFSAVNGVSCASPTMCAAAGGDPIVADGGPAVVDSDVDPLTASINAVSCAPGSHFCAFVDQNGGAFTYADGVFSALDKIDGDKEFDGVACPVAGTCVAIDHDAKVFKLSNGAWSLGSTLPSAGSLSLSGQYAIACASPNFCMALASVSGGATGEHVWTYDGTTWTSKSTQFGQSGPAARSLACASSTFCLETDSAGYANTYNGTTWTSQLVSTSAGTKVLYSGCNAGSTTCRAVGQNNDVYSTTNGTTWTPGSPANIHASTLFGSTAGVACASSICVAGDIGGGETTFSESIEATTKPVLSGTGAVGQTLTVAKASRPQAGVWTTERWWRCDQPGSGCTAIEGVTGPSYSLTAEDAGAYIEARETAGIGLAQSDEAVSNAVAVTAPGGGSGGGGGSTGGSVGGGSNGGTASGSNGPSSAAGGAQNGGATGGTSAPSTAPKVTGTPSATSSGAVSIAISCPATGACSGKATLKTTKVVGSASYSVAAGKKGKLKIKLNASAKAALKKHKKLKVTLTITPTGGSAITKTVTLKLK